MAADRPWRWEMRRCWLLIITNGLRVWMPPEVYLEKGMVIRESRRWVLTLSRRRPPDDLLDSMPFRLRDRVLLHVIETDFVEPWRACPLWVGVRWSERSRRLSTELMAADSGEARDWIRTYSKSALDQRPDPALGLESSFQRRGVATHVAVHRVKRFAGF
jgi:hypothetical protein